VKKVEVERGEGQFGRQSYTCERAIVRHLNIDGSKCLTCLTTVHVNVNDVISIVTRSTSNECMCKDHNMNHSGSCFGGILRMHRASQMA
jgi:hypothetical protein